MIESPEIAEVPSQPAAVIHLAIPRDAMRTEMPAAIQELMATLTSQGIKPAGPLFAHHLRMSSATFDFETGFPVSQPVQAQGRVRPGELPGGKVVRTTYHGPYEGLHAAWAEFGKRAREKFSAEASHLKPGETLWEIYVTGPESSSDPSTWRTELNRPLVAAD